MAASEAILSSWNTPFFTPIRKDEKACRDLFQNSEKLLASAVSICRLKGSVECQTGGLITVCEELQSLIRLAFTEIRRLEKDFGTQKSHLEDEINCLKERVKYLEEAKTAKSDIGKQGNKTFAVDEKNASHESEEVVESALCKDTDYSPSAEDENLEESDPYIFEVGKTGVSTVPVEDTSSLRYNVSSSPEEGKKLNSKKRLKKLSSNKSGSLFNTVNGGDVCNSQQIFSASSSVQGKDAEKNASRRSKSTEETSYAKSDEQWKRNQKRSSSNEQAAEQEESSSTCKSKGAKRGSPSNKEVEENKKEVLMEVQAPHLEVTKESETECTESNKSSKDRAKVKKKKESKKAKNKRSFAAEQESDDVFQAESTDYKTNMSTEPQKDSPGQKKPKGKLSNKLSCGKKSKAVSKECAIKSSEKIEDEKYEKESTLGHEAQTSACENDDRNNNSLNKRLPDVRDKDEPLGDMSFLINVNSQISIFVADGLREECELEPMTARERNAVYKMAQLYKLRARIGTKSENNLTTVRLSKQADTRMPKPGKVDCLLSELSIAAVKEGIKDSPNNQVKRKYAAVVKENQQSLPTCTDGNEQDGPPKKKMSKLFSARKVKT